MGVFLVRLVVLAAGLEPLRGIVGWEPGVALHVGEHPGEVDAVGERQEGDDAKLHVMLFDAPVPASLQAKSVPGDFDVVDVAERAIFIVFYRKPDGTYSGNSAFDLEKRLPKGTLVTSRNWNTILKAIA